MSYGEFVGTTKGVTLYPRCCTNRRHYTELNCVCLCVYIYIYTYIQDVAYTNNRISLYITSQISHWFHNCSPLHSALCFQTLELRNFPRSKIKPVCISQSKTLRMRRSGMNPGNSELSSKQQINSTSRVQYRINHKRLFWRPIKH